MGCCPTAGAIPAGYPRPSRHCYTDSRVCCQGISVCPRRCGRPLARVQGCHQVPLRQLGDTGLRARPDNTTLGIKSHPWRWRRFNHRHRHRGGSTVPTHRRNAPVTARTTTMEQAHQSSGTKQPTCQSQAPTGSDPMQEGECGGSLEGAEPAPQTDVTCSSRPLSHPPVPAQPFAGMYRPETGPSMSRSEMLITS